MYESRVNGFAVMMVLLAFCLLAYWPGLTGTYMLDDFGTLPPLAQWGEINTLDKLAEYALSGFAGPTGRPVALLSFTMSGTTWPTDPFPFLLTNILIHLLNGFLVAVTLTRLLAVANVPEHRKLAIFTAAIWMLHPSQVSAVLYIVQRMALLELTFNLLAILSYLSLRKALLGEQLVKALWLSVLLGLSAILAVCSKENAILIPLQLALIEYFFLSKGHAVQNHYYRLAKWFLIVIPSLVVIGYLLQKGMPYLYSEARSGIRVFTAWERQLTEFRIVGEYILMFLLPKMQSAGVFHDGYLISKNMFTPISTLAWAMFHGIVFVFAIRFRHKWSVLVFAISWFYINHLLESTVIQLELKFEHRNYLPSIGLALLAAIGLLKLPLNKMTRESVFYTAIIMLSLCLYMRASLWGDPATAAGVWVNENPRSHRALEHAAMIYSDSEHGEDKAKEYLKKAMLVSDDPVVELKYILYSCSEQNLSEVRLASLEARFLLAPMNWQIGHVFDGLLGKVIKNECLTVTFVNYHRLLVAALQNKKYRQTQIRLQLQHLRAKSELLLGDKSKAVRIFMMEFNSEAIPLGVIMKQAVLLASHDELKVAYHHIDRAIKNRLAKNDKGFLLAQAIEIRENIRKDM